MGEAAAPARRDGRGRGRRIAAAVAIGAALAAAGAGAVGSSSAAAGDGARSAQTGAVSADLDLRVGPIIRFPARRPVPMTARMRLRMVREDGLDPAVMTRMTVKIPYGASLNGRLFPSCDVKTLDRYGPDHCPRGSKIGSGTARGRGDTVVQRVDVTIFNGRRGRSLIFYTVGYRPALIREALVAPLRRHRGGSTQYTLRITIPRALQVVAGVPIGLEEVDGRIDGRRRVGGRTRGYVEAVMCPPGAQILMPVTFDFLDAPRLVHRGWARCG